jgi:hypothetical protein
MREPGEKSTVAGRIVTAGLVVVLAAGLAVGIGALAFHKDTGHPKAGNAADRQVAAKGPGVSSLPPAKAPVPVVPPGKAGPKKAGTKKRTKAGSAGKAGSGRAVATMSGSAITIVNDGTGMCIDVTKEGRTGIPIQIWNCGPVTDWKRWGFYSDGTIRSQGHCMTVAGGSANGNPIEVTGCNGGASQRFTLNSAHDLVNVAADKCVDIKDKGTVNGTPLQLWSCGGSSNQKWHTA